MKYETLEVGMYITSTHKFLAFDPQHPSSVEINIPITQALTWRKQTFLMYQQKQRRLYFNIQVHGLRGLRLHLNASQNIHIFILTGGEASLQKHTTPSLDNLHIIPSLGPLNAWYPINMADAIKHVN